MVNSDSVTEALSVNFKFLKPSVINPKFCLNSISPPYTSALPKLATVNCVGAEAKKDFSIGSSNFL